MISWEKKTFRKVKLLEVYTIKHGFAFKSENYSNDGKYQLVTLGNFIDKGGFKNTVGKEKFYDGVFPSEYILKEGDLVIAMTQQVAGLLGSTAIIPQNDAFVLNQRVGLINCRQNIDKPFINYLMRSKYIRKQIESTAQGTKQRNTSPNKIYDITAWIPDFTTQKSIGDTLTDLDAKIEVNNKINTALEAMAKTLYDYWFVQFDFPAHLGGTLSGAEGYKSSGGKMVFNEELKREIPEGWEDGVLSDFAECNKWNRTKDYRYTQIKYLDTSNLTKNVIESFQELNFKEDKIPSRAQRIVSNNDILFSTVRPNQLHYGIIKRPIENLIASTGFAQIRSNDSRLTNDFIYQFLSQDYVSIRLQQIAVGSVSAYPSISHNDIMNLKIALPVGDDLIKKATIIFQRYNDKIALNLEENKKLSELRDWLLPMLMNGQVTVDKGYEVAEEKLNIAAEPGLAYENDKMAIDDLFETINYDYEVAIIQLLTERRFGFTYGKKYTHKMFSNIEMLNTMPKFKELAFEEKGWGMFSKAIAKTIDAQKFIYFNQLDHGAQVLKVKGNCIKDIFGWMSKEENKDFIFQVNHMLDIYEKPLINKDMDRIELLNTVLECMKVLETDNLEAIRNRMNNWVMYEENNKTKAEKFNENETLHMIGFVKNEAMSNLNNIK